MLNRRSFLTATLGATMAAGLAPLAFGGPKAAFSFRAGAGKAEITFSAMAWPVDGFSSQHDPLAIRVLLLEFSGIRYAIVVVELTSLSEEIIDDMKTMIAQTAGVAADNTLICASHTFSAPHVFPTAHLPPDTDKAQNQALHHHLNAALANALSRALRNLQPARIGYRSGVSRVNINRDRQSEHGWWLGADDNGFADPFLGTIRIDTRQGKPLAALFNYAVQSSVTENSQSAAGGKAISADLAGATSRFVEEQMGDGMVALFLVGAAGDQAPLFQAMQTVVNTDGSVSLQSNNIDPYALLNLLAERLGYDVVQLLNRTATAKPHQWHLTRQTVTVPAVVFSPQNAARMPVKIFRFQPDGAIDVPITIMRLGDIVWIGLQPELSAITGAIIRQRSPFPATIISTMVEGSVKYMPDARSYDRLTYEARSSPFAQGAAEKVTDEILQTLRQLRAQGKGE